MRPLVVPVARSKIARAPRIDSATLSSLSWQRQDEMPRRFAQGDEAMMPIEVFRLFVLRIHDKRVNSDLGPGGPVYRIP
jgi:hypothetical protein